MTARGGVDKHALDLHRRIAPVKEGDTTRRRPVQPRQEAIGRRRRKAGQKVAHLTRDFLRAKIGVDDLGLVGITDAQPGCLVLHQKAHILSFGLVANMDDLQHSAGPSLALPKWLVV